MSEEEILKIQYEAIKEFCQGDRRLVLRVILELGETLRRHIDERSARGLTSKDLVAVLERETKGWPGPS